MILSCSWFLALAILGADPPADAPIVPDSISLEESGRYRSRRSFDETLDFYDRTFKRTNGLIWHNIINLPGIRAKNIECRKKTNWEGINIYELKGEVRIYVIPRETHKTSGEAPLP